MLLADRPRHVRGEFPLPKGQSISSLACKGQLGNTGVHNKESLEWL